MKIEIYSTRNCGYCLAVRRLLDRKGIPYEDVDVTSDPTRRAWLREVTGRHTVPQVFIDGQPHGGYQDLVALEAAGKLDPILGIGVLPAT